MALMMLSVLLGGWCLPVVEHTSGPPSWTVRAFLSSSYPLRQAVRTVLEFLPWQQLILSQRGLGFGLRQRGVVGQRVSLLRLRMRCQRAEMASLSRARGCGHRDTKVAEILTRGIVSPLAQMEEERREHVAKMKKMEMEMEQVFEMKVKEKIQKLKDSEAELQRRHEQMKKNLEAQHKELEEKRRQFEEDRASWETQQRILEQQKQDACRTLEKNKKKGKIF
ncbi:hypothetical protein JZ751_009747 [Albula glossodonta]|uniref:Uncharacterized protein n=1 Tax=Albula glossodonta TaxID=121402 RepID=A0A8T2P6H6_9TELE|nr:hypothetical protein JZ751_009747 [Albula glossodonta]